MRIISILCFVFIFNTTICQCTEHTNLYNNLNSTMQSTRQINEQPVVLYLDMNGYTSTISIKYDDIQEDINIYNKNRIVRILEPDTNVRFFNMILSEIIIMGFAAFFSYGFFLRFIHY